jgi:hypothetical protein
MTDDPIREYRAGDEAGIIGLFNSVFGEKRTLDRWKWQFAEHPQGLGWIQLAESNGETVGQSCMMRDHLNFCGKEVCAGQSVDAMVRADQRGKKWFVRLAEANYANAAGRGLKAVFGFPNRNSFPDVVGVLGRHRIAALQYFYFRTGYLRVWGSLVDMVFKVVLNTIVSLRTALFKSFIGGSRVVVTDELPAAWDDVLEEIRNHQVLSVWKNVDYLRWRYQDHPEHRYVFHFLYIGGRPEGIIVARDVGTTTAICELLHRTKDVRQSALLLNSVLSYHNRRSIQRIEFFGHDDGFFNAVFAQCGFKSSYSGSFVFSGRVFGDAALEQRFIIPQNWTISYGDTDVI